MSSTDCSRVIRLHEARPDERTPHEQDEVYIVVRGRGLLFHGGKRDAFRPGDFLHLPAKHLKTACYVTVDVTPCRWLRRKRAA
jgi:hypothetical protein